MLKGGGEPTLHPQFTTCVQLLAETECDLGLLTNGSRLREDDTGNAILKHMKYLRVSLDAATPETHAQIHGSDDFELITSGIQFIAERRNGPWPVIGVTFIIEPDACDAVPDMLALAVHLGVDYVQFRLPYLEEVGYAARFTSDEWKDALSAIKNAVYGEKRIPAYISDYCPQQIAGQSGRAPSFEAVTQTCLAHRLMLIVSSDASVYGCCELRNRSGFCLGTLSYPEQTLQYIWESAERFEVIKRMDQTECIRYCTQPVSSYNEALAGLALGCRPYTSFV